MIQDDGLFEEEEQLMEGPEMDKEKFYPFIKEKYKIKKSLYDSRSAFGTAYLTEDNKILKFTTSKREANFFNLIKGKKLKHVVEVYSVAEIKNNKTNSGTGTYIILKEYVPNLLTEAQEDYYTVARRNLSADRKFISKISPLLKPEEGRDASHLSKSVLNKWTEQVGEMFLEIKPYINWHQGPLNQVDAHGGNVGMKDGILKAFDLMGGRPSKIEKLDVGNDEDFNRWNRSEDSETPPTDTWGWSGGGQMTHDSDSEEGEEEKEIRQKTDPNQFKLFEGPVIPDNMLDVVKKKYGVDKLLSKAGFWGSAYLTNDGKVLKFTQDLSEAVLFNSFVGKDYKHIVKVYSVKKLNKQAPFDFLILKDYVPELLDAEGKFYYEVCLSLMLEGFYPTNKILNPAPEKPLTPFEKYNGDAKQYIDKLFEPKQYENFEKFLDAVYSLAKPEEMLDKGRLIWMLTQQKEMFKELRWKKARDWHGSNVGIKDGQLIAFDLSSAVKLRRNQALRKKISTMEGYSVDQDGNMSEDFDDSNEHEYDITVSGSWEHIGDYKRITEDMLEKMVGDFRLSQLVPRDLGSFENESWLENEDNMVLRFSTMEHYRNVAKVIPKLIAIARKNGDDVQFSLKDVTGEY